VSGQLDALYCYYNNNLNGYEPDSVVSKSDTKIIHYISGVETSDPAQSVGLLGWGISPSQGRYLHTEQHKHRINAYIHPCLE
jgi:hypothetical protein